MIFKEKFIFPNFYFLILSQIAMFCGKRQVALLQTVSVLHTASEGGITSDSVCPTYYIWRWHYFRLCLSHILHLKAALLQTVSVPHTACEGGITSDCVCPTYCIWSWHYFRLCLSHILHLKVALLQTVSVPHTACEASASCPLVSETHVAVCINWHLFEPSYKMVLFKYLKINFYEKAVGVTRIVTSEQTDG